MANLPKNEDIRTAMKEYCSAKKISQNELAVQIGINSSYLSLLETGKGETIAKAKLRKIWNYVSAVNSAPERFKTADYKAAIDACQSAKENQFMIAVIGDTGMGKTTALTDYSLQENVFYVVCERAIKPKQFFLALLRKMGVAFEGSIYEMCNRIADELNTLDEPLLIIDEAGMINDTMMSYIQNLRDKTVKNCGIILGGMPYFRTNLQKFSDKGKQGVAEFMRRINIWQTLEGLSNGEVEFVCNSNGIADKEMVREMKRYKRFGDLQNAITLYNLNNNEEA